MQIVKIAEKVATSLQDELVLAGVSVEQAKRFQHNAALTIASMLATEQHLHQAKIPS